MTSSTPVSSHALSDAVDMPCMSHDTETSTRREGVLLNVDRLEQLQNAFPEGSYVNITVDHGDGGDGNSDSKYHLTMRREEESETSDGNSVSASLTVGETASDQQQQLHTRDGYSLRHKATVNHKGEIRVPEVAQASVEQQTNGTVEDSSTNSNRQIMPLAYRANTSWWMKLSTREKVECELALCPQTPLSLYHRIHLTNSSSGSIAANPPPSFLSVIKPICRTCSELTTKGKTAMPEYFLEKSCFPTKSHVELLPSVWSRLSTGSWRIALSDTEEAFIAHMQGLASEEVHASMHSDSPSTSSNTDSKNQYSDPEAYISSSIATAIDQHLSSMPALPAESAGSALMDLTALKGIKAFDTYQTVPLRPPRDEAEFRELARRYNTAAEMYGQLRRATDRLVQRYRRADQWKAQLQKLVNQLREVLGNSMPSDSTKRIIDNSKDSVQRVNRFLKVALTDLQWCSEKLGELHVFHQQLQTVFQMKPTEALQLELMGH